MQTDAAPTKTAEHESFPVASRLLRPRERAVILAFYEFARAADDVADAPGLSAAEKLVRLDAIEDALLGRTDDAPGADRACRAARRAAAALAQEGIPVEHAVHLLQAFRRDAAGAHYESWSDLMLYCTFSAAPVGRMLLDLHREPQELRPAADALCAAHQILNHLQDCGRDRAGLDRVYLPARMLGEAGASASHLDRNRLSPELRMVLDAVLDRVDELILQASRLSRDIRDGRLRFQADMTLRMARRLHALLARRDPLAERVDLSPAARLGCALAALPRLGSRAA